MSHSTMRFRNARHVTAVSLIAAIMAALAIVFVGTTVSAAPAQALCVGPDTISGTWRNTDPNTRSVTRVDVNWGCADQVLCPVGGSCVTPGGSVRVYGKCHPTDCDWGTRTIYVEKDGWRKATYHHSWATKHVWLRPYTFSGREYLRVWVYTNFTQADGRTDYASDQWMQK